MSPKTVTPNHREQKTALNFAHLGHRTASVHAPSYLTTHAVGILWTAETQLLFSSTHINLHLDNEDNEGVSLAFAVLSLPGNYQTPMFLPLLPSLILS